MVFNTLLLGPVKRRVGNLEFKGMANISGNRKDIAKR